MRCSISLEATIAALRRLIFARTKAALAIRAVGGMSKARPLQRPLRRIRIALDFFRRVTKREIGRR
jgi:hypothetical protein